MNATMPPNSLDHIGAYGLDAGHLWLFDRTGKLVRYDQYEL